MRSVVIVVSRRRQSVVVWVSLVWGWVSLDREMGRGVLSAWGALVAGWLGVGRIRVAGMFVLELTYVVPLERVEELLDEHVGWLKGHYEAGVFLASGRKEPRDGGVILAVGNDVVAVRELVETDPFMIAGVCEYRVVQFVATNVAAELERYREMLS
jgi:uncharacterized protein YciI